MKKKMETIMLLGGGGGLFFRDYSEDLRHHSFPTRDKCFQDGDSNSDDLNNHVPLQ